MLHLQNSVIGKLLDSPEPSIRYRILVDILGENGHGRKLQQLQKSIKESGRVGKLLDGLWMGKHQNVYAKWQGIHWILVALSELHYPPGDKNLIPFKNQLLDHWLSPRFYKDFMAVAKKEA